jgi:hypothetical protein
LRVVDEPTAVEARFETDGAVRPRRFTWTQSWLDVSDVGRQWIDADGRHVLVITGGRHTFELRWLRLEQRESRMRKSRSIRSTYSVLVDPRFSSQSRENKAPQGINVERSQREIRRGAGTDAVQEETGELGEAATFSSTARRVRKA